ncbi:MAG: MMPL family transporter [Acidobacteriota bacterium]
MAFARDLKRVVSRTVALGDDVEHQARSVPLIDRVLKRLPAVGLRAPRATVALALLVVAAALPGLLRLELRTNGHALVPPADPAVLLDAEVRQRYDLRDPIAVVVETDHPDGIFNRDTLRRVRQLSDRLVALEGLGDTYVSSLATEKRDRVYTGSLRFRPFLEPVPENDQEMEILVGDLEATQILDGTLVALDGRATTLLVGVPAVHGEGPEADERRRLFEAVRREVEAFDAAPDRVLVVGAPVAEGLLGLHILEDLAFLLPLAMAVIALVVWLGCRRLWGVGLALGEVGASLLFTFGVMGWLGVPVYLTTAILPVILTTLGLADEIHILWRYQKHLAAGADRPVEQTFAELVRPVALTSMTTTLAFLSFLVSEIPPVRFFGIFAAVGILFCMSWSLAVVPAILSLLGPERLRRPRGSAEGWGRSLTGLAPRATTRGPVLALLATVTLVLAAGIPRLFVQDSWIDGFADGSPFRVATERVDERFFGTHVLLAHLEFDPREDDPGRKLPGLTSWSGPLFRLETLEAFGEFEDFLRRQPGVGGVLGPYSQLVTVSYLWMGRQEGGRKLPDSPYQLGRLLDRFDMARGKHKRREVLDDSLTGGVVTIFLEDANFRDTAALIERLEAGAERFFGPHGGRLELAGDVAVSQAMIPAIVRTQVSSLLLALLGAWVVVSLLYRSARWGALAILPSAVAVAWVFGLMGWLAIPLGVATSMFCAVTLGIGVDYAIHFLESFRRSRQIGEAVAETGPAIISDSLAICLGFGLLGLSQVPANARLGLLVAVALLSAAVLTLVGLAALLRPKESL